MEGQQKEEFYRDIPEEIKDHGDDDVKYPVSRIPSSIIPSHRNPINSDIKCQRLGLIEK